ncbi:hypothetical protein BDR26DRAFT_1000246 [Obelidium mucronatum]|nr:hypothetical protein BDR26DRAFT_1000246 [Obelidium mucronatum]
MNYGSALAAMVAVFLAISVSARSTLDLGSPCSMTPATKACWPPVPQRSSVYSRSLCCSVTSRGKTSDQSKLQLRLLQLWIAAVALARDQASPLLTKLVITLRMFVGNFVATGSPCDVPPSGETFISRCEASDTCLYPSYVTAATDFSTYEPSSGVCVPSALPLPMPVPAGSPPSCNPCTSVLGHLLQVNEMVLATGSPKRNPFPSSNVGTGQVCDNVPYAISRCGATDFCLYTASNSQNKSAVCTPMSAKGSLPPQITSLDSSKPTCVQDTGNVCQGFWICYIGNNGMEPVYYCDGEIDNSNGFSNYIGWNHPREVKLVVGGVNTTAPLTGDEGSQNVGLIAGIAVAAALILAGLGYYYWRLKGGKDTDSISDASKLSLKSSKTVESACPPNQTASNLYSAHALTSHVFQKDATDVESSNNSTEYISVSFNQNQEDLISTASPSNPKSNADLPGTPTTPAAPISAVSAVSISIPSIPMPGAPGAPPKLSSAIGTTPALSQNEPPGNARASMISNPTASTTARLSLISSTGSSAVGSDTLTTSTANNPRFSANINVHSVPGFYRSLQDYTSDVDGELSYTVDSRVYVTSKPDAEGWCNALIGSSAGRVHSSCLGPIG